MRRSMDEMTPELRSKTEWEGIWDTNEKTVT